MYNIDFNRLVTWLLPGLITKPKFQSWLRGLIEPLKTIQKAFNKNRESNLYKLRHNSQVFSIVNVLNDRFDNGQRRIYITDGLTKDRIYIHTRQELKPLFLGQIFLWNRGDYADTGVDFIVWIPVQIFITPQDLIEVRALITYYKLSGKRFKIYRV